MRQIESVPDFVPGHVADPPVHRGQRNPATQPEGRNDTRTPVQLAEPEDAPVRNFAQRLNRDARLGRRADRDSRQDEEQQEQRAGEIHERRPK